MAQRRVTIEVCDRDAFGKEREATETRILSVDGSYYELRLCDQHAAMFDRDISGWTRVARDIEPPNAPSKSEWFTEERKRETERIRELRDKAAADAASKEFAARRRAEIEKEDALTQAERDELSARQVIPGALKWRLTDHARERMLERDFQIAEVLRAAARPHTSAPSKQNPSLMVNERGDCRVVVDPATYLIITVVDRAATLDLETSTDKERKLL